MTPAALQLVMQSDLSTKIKEDLSLVHRNWLEAQGLIRNARRVLAITGEPSDHGLIEGNVFHVFSGSMESFGVHRESAHVVESLRADARYLQLLMRLALDLNDTELRRFWCSKAELGGGAAMHAYVARYVDDPTPTFLVCDRDGPNSGECGPTAQGCIDALIAANLFNDPAEAITGGYSSLSPCLGFRILAAHEMENLILPRMAAILFDQILPANVATQRSERLLDVFPTFPNLSNEEAERWLSTDFKVMPGGPSVFNNASLEDISTWANSSQENWEFLRREALIDFKNPTFFLAINDVVLDVWTHGLRHRAFV